MYLRESPHFEWLNCFIQLDGMHWFKKDRAWGLLLNRFHDGTVSREDIKTIKKECTTSMQNVGEDGIVNDAVLILSDGLAHKSREQTWEAMTTRKFFCENLGEDDLTPKQCRPRVDPVLKLF